MITGRFFISTGFQQTAGGRRWHLLAALRRRWRLDLVRPYSKPDYRRLYVGPLEIEWSRT